jgi:hypothetical protein
VTSAASVRRAGVAGGPPPRSLEVPSIQVAVDESLRERPDHRVSGLTCVGGGVPARGVTVADVAAAKAEAQRGLYAALLAGVGPGVDGLIDRVNVLACALPGPAPKLVGQPQPAPLAGCVPETHACSPTIRPAAMRRWRSMMVDSMSGDRHPRHLRPRAGRHGRRGSTTPMSRAWLRPGRESAGAGRAGASARACG